ncbi:MAG: hypothetical protein AAGB22_03620 [Bacteroidota bacterium]
MLYSSLIIYGAVVLIASQIRYGRLWALWTCTLFSALELIIVLLFGMVLTGGGIARLFVPGLVLFLCVRALPVARVYQRLHRPGSLDSRTLDESELRP